MNIDIRIHPQDRIEARFAGLTLTTAQDGSAPAPFDLYLASVGTCGGFYLSRFCGQRGISTAGIRISQEVVRDQETRRVTAIDLQVELPDDFPEKYRKAALRAMEQCTVSRSLAAPPEISVRLAPARCAT